LLLPAASAVELLPLEAAHLRGAHLRRGKPRATTLEGRRSTAPATMASAALEHGRATAPLRATAATPVGVAAASTLFTAAVGTAASTSTLENRSAAAPMGVSAAMLLAAAAVGVAAAIAMLLTATTVPASGARICRDGDRQRGNARGEKQPAQHENSPFERKKRSVRCTVPTPKRMELAL
jgi:hypothetical protein